MGIRASVVEANDGSLRLLADSMFGFFTRDRIYRQVPGTNGPPEPTGEWIPLLNERSQELAGVPIGNLNRKIEDHDLREKIRAKLKTMLFHMKYLDMKRQKQVVVHNKRMFCKKQEGEQPPEIIWCADDPKDHSFDYSVRETDGSTTTSQVTVQQYYQMKRGITLRYPKMPLIYTGRSGYLPLELLYQTRGEKAVGYDAKVSSKLNWH